MCVLVYVFLVYVYMCFLYMCTCVSCISSCICVRDRGKEFLYMCVIEERGFVYVCVCLCVCVCVFMCMRVCLCVCMCVLVWWSIGFMCKSCVCEGACVIGEGMCVYIYMYIFLNSLLFWQPPSVASFGGGNTLLASQGGFTFQYNHILYLILIAHVLVVCRCGVG